MKFVCFSLFLICLFTAAAISQPARSKNKSLTKIGEAMPAFSLTASDGKEFSVAALEGKIIYVNFWATWCPPCLEEFPCVEKEIWEKYKASENFAMVAIAREQSADEILPFRNKYTFPMASDLDRQVYKLFGDSGLPRSYVVGANGRILFQSIGYDPTEFSRMIKIIDAALNESEKKPDESKEILPKN